MPSTRVTSTISRSTSCSPSKKACTRTSPTPPARSSTRSTAPETGTMSSKPASSRASPTSRRPVAGDVGRVSTRHRDNGIKPKAGQDPPYAGRRNGRRQRNQNQDQERAEHPQGDARARDGLRLQDPQGAGADEGLAPVCARDEAGDRTSGAGQFRVPASVS